MDKRVKRSKRKRQKKEHFKKPSTKQEKQQNIDSVMWFRRRQIHGSENHAGHGNH